MQPTADSNPYQPIDCSFHDQLLAWATMRRPVFISYRDDAGQESVVRSIIADVFTENGAEYLQLREGTKIRLDYLIQVTESDPADG